VKFVWFLLKRLRLHEMLLLPFAVVALPFIWIAVQILDAYEDFKAGRAP
jgi:hypothetical protein